MYRGVNVFMELVELLVLCFLSAASMQDLREGEVYNFTFFLGFGSVSVARVFSGGVSVLFGMGVGVASFVLPGYLLHRKGSLGFADVYALGLTGSALYNISVVSALIVLAGVSLLYNILVTNLTGRETVRLLPALTISYVVIVLI